MRKAIVYVAIRGDPTGKFYVYRYIVVSPSREEGCGVVCDGCDGHKAWYMAIPKVLEEVKPKYDKVELRTHFSHLAKGLFRMELSDGVTVKHVDEEENRALKGIDKCLALAKARWADPRYWQHDFFNKAVEVLNVEKAPVIALNAPTGSGKTVAALRVAKYAVDMGMASIAIAVVRAKTQAEAFIRDNERFGIGFQTVRLPSKESACIKIKMAPRPPRDWDEEEKMEYLAMLARRAKCDVCPLNFDTGSIGPDALKRIVVEATIEKKGADDEPYVEALKNKLQEEAKTRLGPAAERIKVCAYSAVKKAVAYMVEKGEPVLVVGVYPHVLSHARALLLDICRPSAEKDEEEELDSAAKGREEPKCLSVVVFDEAHNLWETVKDYNMYSISDARILKVAKDLAAYCKEHPKEGWCTKFKKIGGVDNVLRVFAEELGKYAELNSSRKLRRDVEVKMLEPPDIFVEVMEVLSAVLETACRPYLDETGDLINDDQRIFRTYMLMKTTKRFLKVLKGEETRWGIYSVVNKRQRSFVLLPIDLRGIVSRARKAFYGPWMLLSGTLSRKEIEDLLGGGVIFYNASVKFGKLSMRFAVSRDASLLTTRDVERNEDMYRKYATAIPRVLRGAAGPARLVVYPNYQVMNAIRKYYVSPGDAEEYWESPGEKFKDEIVEDIRKGKQKDLHVVARGSFAEGIEIKLEDGRSAIRTVVAAGIPVPKIFSDYYVDVARHFGYLDDKCVESLHRAPDFADAPKKCKTKMFEWGYTLAETTLKQIIGRAIRGPQDSATLYLLDTRIAAVPRLKDALCRGLHYKVEECVDIPDEELLKPI
jgi:Rad3-related DNA helicase